jgi:SagB-type dehydrogenase family enzyme
VPSASGKRLAAYIVWKPDAAIKSQPAAENATGVLLDVSQRDSLKHRGLQFRPRHEASGLVALDGGPVSRESFLERRSHRSFQHDPLPFVKFSRWLSSLRQFRIDGEAKYRYASAGGVYPIQTYLSIKPGRVQGIEAGTYYYHPLDHELHRLGQTDVSENVHWPSNREAFRNAALSVFLIAEKAAIEPLYGSKARDFCLIEAGIMMQLLEAASAECGIGNCQIGSLDFDRIRDAFRLTPTQELVHSSVAGYAIPATQAAHIEVPVTSAQPAASPASFDSLRGHLASLLPSYMVPAAWAAVASIPLSANGKVDRKALPPFEESRPAASVPESAGTRDMRARLANAMAEELGIQTVSLTENFFDLGATSLTLVRFTNRLLAKERIEVPIVDVFRYPTIAALAQRLSETAPVEQTAAEEARAEKARGKKSRLARARQAAAME